MPEERGYTRQVETRAAAPMPKPTAAQYGAGLGREIEQVGETWQREALEDYAIARQKTADEQWTGFLKGYAAHQENISSVTLEARKDGSTGHAARMGEAWEAARSPLLDGISDDRLRNRAELMFDEGGGRYRVGERTFEDARRVERVTTDFDEWRATDANRVRRLDKPDDYMAAQRDAAIAIDTLDVGQDVKDKLHRETGQIYAVSFLQGVIARTPDVAKALIAAGSFDDVLEPQQIEALLNRSDVEIRTQQVAAARVAAAETKKVGDAIQIFEQDDTAGKSHEADEYDSAIAAARAIGDEPKANNLEALKRNSDFAKVWGPDNASPVEREQRMGELARKRDRSDAEDFELKYLQDKSGGWAEEWNKDPTGALTRSPGGDAPPAIDLEDASSWSPRVKWAANRGVPPFSRTEAGVLQEQLAKPGGEQTVLGALDAIPGGLERASAAEQIAPKDPLFQRLAQMPTQVRAVVRQGKKALDANPSFFKVPGNPRVSEATAEADRRIAYALREVDQDFITGTQSAWRYYAAGNLAANGATDGSALSEDSGAGIVRNSLNVALGGEIRRRPNGSKQWVGGLGDWRGRDVVLPENMTMTEFGSAAANDLGRKINSNPPVNPDGSRFNLFKGAFPVLLRDRVYGWRTGRGAVVRAKDGQPFITDLTQ